MGRMGGFQAEDLKKFREELVRLDRNADVFLQACARELAAKLLGLVVNRTLTGEYPKGSGKEGGTLKRGWTGGRESNAEAYANSLGVRHVGDAYVIDIINPVFYAPYVEYGHRTPNHKGWVTGRFMMSISVRELEKIAPQVLENKIKKYLGGCFK